MRSVLSFLLMATGLYAGLCLLMFVVQRSQIYFPVPESFRPGASSMRFVTEGAELKIWVVARPGPKALLYFGGNAEDVSFNLDAFAATFPLHSIYLVNYRGYGGSSGRPSEPALVADAIALYDHLRSRHPEISVVGRSLGGGVAVHLASVRDVRRLALVVPFDSLVSVARAHFPWLPVGFLLRDRYDSGSRAARVTAETLIVAAGADEIVPRSATEALAAALPPDRSRMLILEGARHNEIDLRPQFLEELGAFLAR